jgi:hypothetical protein
MTTQRWHFSVESELAVIGHDPEFADMDNPTGAIIQPRYFMVATDAEGYQKRWGWCETPEQAEMGFEFVAPAVNEWPLWRCVYGSHAYEVMGCEQEQLAAEMEADLGSDWRVKAPEVAFAIAC